MTLITTRASLHTYPIVGAFYHPPAKAILNTLPIGTNLFLRPDSKGATTISDHDDPTAIAVYIDISEIEEIITNEKLKQTFLGELANSGYSLDEVLDSGTLHLGYIPKNSASKLVVPDFHKAKFTTTIDGKPAITFNV